jgi:Leucine-rich repeat (LRR) protein
MKELNALQKLDLSFNSIKRIEGIETNIHIRILVLSIFDIIRQ